MASTETTTGAIFRVTLGNAYTWPGARATSVAVQSAKPLAVIVRRNTPGDSKLNWKSPVPSDFDVYCSCVVWLSSLTLAPVTRAASPSVIVPMIFPVACGMGSWAPSPLPSRWMSVQDLAVAFTCPGVARVPPAVTVVVSVTTLPAVTVVTALLPDVTANVVVAG